MEDLLKTTVPDGGFKIVEDLKASPVPNDIVLENIRQSKEINAPVLKKKPKHEGVFIFVAGGSSLMDHLDELKARFEKGDHICTSNMTHDYLVDKGIIPTSCMIIDPKERVKDYIKKPQKTTKYYIGTVCDKRVAQNLLDAGCDVEKLLVAYGMDDESDIKLQKDLYGNEASYNFLVGGTMAGLRAMPMAVLLGFTKLEFYGFDSCFSNNYKLVMAGSAEYEETKKKKGRKVFIDSMTNQEYVIDFPDEGGFYYAYDKARGEDIQIAETPDGRRFLTSPVFAHQAKQFIKWVDRMEGKLDVICHGDNLSTALLDCFRTSQEQARLLANTTDRRWSDEYAEIQRKLHEQDNYGKWGDEDIELVGRSIVSLYHALRRNITILDYGCGNGIIGITLKNLFNAVEVTGYDPFVPEYSSEQEGQFDVVTCFDVMEHIEFQYVENTLKYIAARTKYMAVFSIALCDAVKELEDGRNAHITQKSGAWWIKELSKRFNVVEAVYSANNSFYVCQAFDAKETMDNELKAKAEKTEQREVCA